jgi:galactofuranose transport system substrate-binding protein
MRRRAILQLAEVAALAAVTGCSTEKPSKPRKPYNAKIVLGFSQVGSESAWREANTASIKRAASLNGVDLRFENADGQQDRQFAAIRSFLAAKVDVIAFSPTVESGWDGILNEVKSAGIPVVIVDRVIDSEDTSLFASAVGANFLGEGSTAGVWAVAAAAEAARTFRIAEIQGTKGSAPAIQRAAGFREVLADRSKLKIIGSAPGDWTVASGRAAMGRLLAEHDDIDLVFAHNDDMGLGAVAALEKAGLEPGTDVRIITVDASRNGMKALVAGKLNYIVECSPIIGPQLMSLVVDLYLGIRVPRQVYTEMKAFGPADAAEALPGRAY